MPQATIKLQSAPAPASSAKKPSQSAPTDSLKPEGGEKIVQPSKLEIEDESSVDTAPSEVPTPFLIAAAVLALAALGIQIWTFIS
jgi:hypothetical protein